MVIQFKPAPLQYGIKYKSSGVEEFKDKTDRDTIDQIREKHESLKNITALYLET